jgi:Uma2 family endonuclease
MVTEPPVLVEVVSLADTYSEIQERVQDYRSMGVRVIWIIDPRTQTGRMSINGISPLSEDVWLLARMLKVPGTTIQVNLDQLLAKLQ